MWDRINWFGVFRTVLVVAVLAGVFIVLHRVRSVLTPFIIAAAVAYVLHPVVLFGERRGLSRGQSIALTYLLVAVLFGVMLLFVIPMVVEEINRLVDNVPTYISQLQEALAQLERFYAGTAVPPSVRETINQALEKYLDRLETRLDIDASLNALLAGIGGMFGVLFNFVLGPILAVYLLKDRAMLRDSFHRMVPTRYRGHATRLLADINRVLSGFVHGRLIVSAIVGVIVTVALAFLGVRFYLILGLFAGLTNLIPYFGPFIGAVPTLLLAAMESWGMILWVAVIYIVIQQLDGFLLTPRVLANRTGLHPIAVVFAVLAGGSLLGFWGLFLGVPLAAVIKVCLDHLFTWFNMIEPT